MIHLPAPLCGASASRPRRSPGSESTAIPLRGLASCALVIAVAACGKRGDPLPPLPRTPQAVTGFTVAQKADVLEVAMVAPRLTTGGQTLGVLDLELLRLEGPGELDKTGKKQRFRAAPDAAS